LSVLGFGVMSTPDMYRHEVRDNQFEREELGFTSEDTDDDDTADAVAYYVNHEEKATDELYKILERAEIASHETPSPSLVCDENLYLRVAGWTKGVSNEIGHMKIAFNSMHSQYLSRVRLEKAKLRRLDERGCRRINELSAAIDKNRSVMTKMEELHREQDTKINLLREQLDLVKAENLGAREARDVAELREGVLRRQNIRIQRQNVLLKRQLVEAIGKTQIVETSIKQRPRRCSAPSVLDLTAD
jgi:hypothetical protein